MRALLPYRLVRAYFLFLLFNELGDFEGPRGLERVLHKHTHTSIYPEFRSVGPLRTLP